jgi:hypothetical protein
MRRVEFIANGWGDAVLLGTKNSSGTLRIKELLYRARTIVCQAGASKAGAIPRRCCDQKS